MLRGIESVVAGEKLGYMLIDGATPSAERFDSVARFQSDDTCRVAVLSLLAASQGITLTAADTVVFAELHWTPGIIEQAENRAHRIGQKASVCGALSHWFPSEGLRGGAPVNSCLDRALATANANVFPGTVVMRAGQCALSACKWNARRPDVETHHEKSGGARPGSRRQANQDEHGAVPGTDRKDLPGMRRSRRRVPLR